MSEAIACHACRWWAEGIHHADFIEHRGEHVGDCRAEPPRIVTEYDRAILRAAWPVTQAHHWCAAFRSGWEGGAA